MRYSNKAWRVPEELIEAGGHRWQHKAFAEGKGASSSRREAVVSASSPPQRERGQGPSPKLSMPLRRAWSLVGRTEWVQPCAWCQARGCHWAPSSQAASSGQGTKRSGVPGRHLRFAAPLCRPNLLAVGVGKCPWSALGSSGVALQAAPAVTACLTHAA